MSQLKHSDVARAFIEGRSAHNRRLSTNGQTVVMDGQTIAAKAPDGTILRYDPRRRSGSIARKAILWEAIRAGVREYSVSSDAIRYPCTAAQLQAAYSAYSDLLALWTPTAP